MAIHDVYDTLTDVEKKFVDDVFTHAFTEACSLALPLSGDDKAERAVEAFAIFVVASRAGHVRKINPIGILEALRET